MPCSVTKQSIQHFDIQLFVVWFQNGIELPYPNILKINFMFNFTEGILKHSDMLASYARKLTQDRDIARDLCQDTIFKALANRESFNKGTDVKPWLFTIMRNLFINGYRRKKLEKNLFSRSSAELLDHPDPETHLFPAHRTELKEIQSVIHQMPEILRVPIRLYCEGYKYQEIAAITETAIGTTKSRIYMARQMLRKKVARGVA
jgi:RNA polymerase sigma factor (sigma-70 family)